MPARRRWRSPASKRDTPQSALGLCHTAPEPGSPGTHRPESRPQDRHRLHKLAGTWQFCWRGYPRMSARKCRTHRLCKLQSQVDRDLAWWSLAGSLFTAYWRDPSFEGEALDKLERQAYRSRSECRVDLTAPREAPRRHVDAARVIEYVGDERRFKNAGPDCSIARARPADTQDPLVPRHAVNEVEEPFSLPQLQPRHHRLRHGRCAIDERIRRPMAE